MKKPLRIAVLGAGIMGCSTAIFLARKGFHVSIFDKEKHPFSAASRWNEGKIHLGFIYSADPSLRTASHVIPGGLNFRPLIEELVGTSLAPAITSEDDLYLCHRDSVTSASEMMTYMEKVVERVRAHPDAKRYLADVSDCRVQRLNSSQLANLTSSPDIVAGFRAPERSVETNWVAEKFISALAEEKLIEPLMGVRITAAHPTGDSAEGTWSIETSEGTFGPYDYVINSLWQGRMAIDQTAGIEPTGTWSNRYRQSLFVRTRATVNTPCAVIATGPFGDIKNYNGRDFYLSWYPDGLRVDSSDVLPPDIKESAVSDSQALKDSIFQNLESLLPWAAQIREQAEYIYLEGGWVFAAGQGLLSDPKSTLHRRSDYGITRHGRYFSVDTGKYSTAPFLAKSLAHSLAE
ncbi:FAD-binding oxidoreductase [Acidovorax sp. 100]|uniref:FAD-dependent oxidoreductase n=1 Tax=Acidovorax sp. 100 TaxID=2135635 RepID=UPI000EF9E183|nr:FAD-binding oxidoreductase [Acidovorax sp. 100]